MSLALPASGEISGVVRSTDGSAVAGARIDWITGDGELLSPAFSDAAGRFEIPDATPPGQISVSHRRYSSESFVVDEIRDEELAVVLLPAGRLSAELTVTDSFTEDVPVTLSSAVVEPEDLPAPPSNTVDLIESVPGVARNGQDGPFQVVSIRGTSRQRVLTLLGGMRISSERRAGTSASFIDALLLEDVLVTRGPASTRFGAGAVGGVVELGPRSFDGTSVTIGFDTDGNEHHQVLGWGKRTEDSRLSVGIARRESGESKDPTGATIPSSFEQTSMTLSRQATLRGFETDLLLVAALGNDLGKPNSDFPERITTYPEERHLFLRGSIRGEQGWLGQVWVHPQLLETRTERSGGRLNLVENDSLDLGATIARELRSSGDLQGRFGIDWYGRRDVDAIEIESGPGREPTLSATLLDAAQDELSIRGSLEGTLGRALITGGARVTWTRQENASSSDAPSISDEFGSGFAGVVMPLGRSVDLILNAGTGFRFPTLSERFFTGTTGRGEVVGSLDLEPERSLSLDAGVRLRGASGFGEIRLFRNRIEDYIERIDLEPGVRSYVNLDSATIEGIELDGAFSPGSRLLIHWGGHLIEGEDDGTGGPVADVPPARFFVSPRYGDVGRIGGWELAGRLEYRDELSEPGPGERSIPDATLLSASLSHRLSDALLVTFSGRNLLDEKYFASADDKIVLSPKRSFAVTLRYSR